LIYSARWVFHGQSYCNLEERAILRKLPGMTGSALKESRTEGDNFQAVNRRNFLNRSAKGGVGLLILGSAKTAFAYEANEQLSVAVVGMKGYGGYHSFAANVHRYGKVRYTHSCDVDRSKVQSVYDFWKQRAAEWGRSDKESERKAAKEHYARLAKTPPPLWKDFREMLEKAGDEIDAVCVATPDHTHASISAAALRAGKPVFSEKPLTISAHEARGLFELQKKTGLPTQMNNHGASSPRFRRGLEILQDGVIGPVGQVHVFFSRGGRNFQSTPQLKEVVPSTLDWNLWLAQLKWRDYHPDWINRIAWRETSIGELGNFAPHTMNLAYQGLGLRKLWEGASTVIKISAEASEVNHVSYPAWERVHWQVPGRIGMPPVKFTWHHGFPPDYAPGSRKEFHELLADHGASDELIEKHLASAGCLFVGSKGLLVTNSHNTRISLLPEKKFEGIEQSKPMRLPVSPGHTDEWIKACRGEEIDPICNFDRMAPFAEFLNAGSLATRFPGVELIFDPSSGTLTGHAAAAQLTRYQYRDGWSL